MAYTINQYGVIKVDGQVVVMEESSSSYQDYLVFLQGGGTVEDVIDNDPPPPTQLFSNVAESDQITIGNAASDNAIIQDILIKLDALQAEVDELKQTGGVV